MSSVVKAVVKGWQQEADKVGITLLVEDSSQGCLVKVKHFNLDMILNTLMASALIRSDANQIIHLSAKLDDGRLLIAIEDTGKVSQKMKYRLLKLRNLVEWAMNPNLRYQIPLYLLLPKWRSRVEGILISIIIN